MLREPVGRSSRDQMFTAWSHQHGDINPRSSLWIRGWVVLSNAGARPLARLGVRPNVVTAVGMLLTAAALGAAAGGRWWAAVAAALIVAAAVADGVDGALAAQTRTVTTWGRVLDSCADRCSDLMLVGVLVVLGASPWTGAALGVLTLLLESIRATAQAAGMSGPGCVTWWERPSRVIVAAGASLAAAVMWWAGAEHRELPLTSGDVAALVTVAGIVLAVVATVQLLIAVRRRTR